MSGILPIGIPSPQWGPYPSNRQRVFAKNRQATLSRQSYGWLNDSHRNRSFVLHSTSAIVITVPMARHCKADDVRQNLSAEIAAKANAIRQKYGPVIGWNELQTLLQDRDCTPFPCEIRFDCEPLLPGEFAHPVPKGASREQGFVIFIHPFYATELARVPYLVLHQLVLINYGESATADDAETFGSLALGMSKEDYYRALCELSGQIAGDDLV